MEAGFEAAERGEDCAIEFARVGASDAVEVVIGFERPALRVDGRVGARGGELVFVDCLFHAIDAEKTPFIDGEFIDEVTFGEVAGAKVGARGFDEGGEPADAFGTDGEDLEVNVKGAGSEVFGRAGLISLHRRFLDWRFAPGARETGSERSARGGVKP
jgi:hypothetical protein